MIESPKSGSRKAGIRVVVEALAQAMPITAGLAHIYGFMHPTEMERLVVLWRDQASDNLNVHEARLRRIEEKLAPRQRVSDIAKVTLRKLVLSSRISSSLRSLPPLAIP